MIKRTIALALLIALPGLAQATPVNLGGSEKNLQTILDELTTSGPSSVNVLTDQYGPDELWKVTATGNATATLIVEIAGNAPYNEFGIYDPTNPSSRVALFGGSASAGAPATITLFADGSVFVNSADSGVDLAGNHFGFYLATIKDNVVKALWHSEASRNADQADHMVAYRGTGDEVQLPNRFPGPWTPNEFILAWEDLPSSKWDYDYNDFVVMVESVIGVPEPAGLALLGLGLAGMALRRRKRA